MEIKRKILSDSEAMSGAGWRLDDDIEYDCPQCDERIDIKDGVTKTVCPECGFIIKIEYGMQLLIRLSLHDDNDDE